VPRQTAAQKLVRLDSYSDAIPPNPLLEMREELEFSQQEMATRLGVVRGVINSAEDGMFAVIPPCYRRHIHNIMTTNGAYQLHRREKRLFYFDKVDFPDAPAKRKPMLALLEHFALVPYKFGARSCIHQAELWKLCTTKRSITGNAYEFFTLIGLDSDWIDQFNVGLSYNALSPVRLPSS